MNFAKEEITNKTYQNLLDIPKQPIEINHPEIKLAETYVEEDYAVEVKFPYVKFFQWLLQNNWQINHINEMFGMVWGGVFDYPNTDIGIFIDSDDHNPEITILTVKKIWIKEVEEILGFKIQK